MAIRKKMSDTDNKQPSIIKKSYTRVKDFKNNTVQTAHKQADRLIKNEKVPDYQIPKLKFLLKILALIAVLIVLELVLKAF